MREVYWCSVFFHSIHQNDMGHTWYWWTCCLRLSDARQKLVRYSVLYLKNDELNFPWLYRKALLNKKYILIFSLSWGHIDHIEYKIKNKIIIITGFAKQSTEVIKNIIIKIDNILIKDCSFYNYMPFDSMRYSFNLIILQFFKLNPLLNAPPWHKGNRLMKSSRRFPMRSSKI